MESKNYSFFSFFTSYKYYLTSKYRIIFSKVPFVCTRKPIPSEILSYRIIFLLRILLLTHTGIIPSTFTCYRFLIRRLRFLLHLVSTSYVYLFPMRVCYVPGYFRAFILQPVFSAIPCWWMALSICAEGFCITVFQVFLTNTLLW